MKIKFGIPIFCLFLLANCDGEEANQSLESNAERKITKQEFGQNWPFTLNEGILKCIDGGVVFIANGKTYAVNGLAKGQGKSRGYSDVEEIWAIDSTLTDANNTIRIGIQSVLDEGLKMCK